MNSQGSHVSTSEVPQWPTCASCYTADRTTEYGTDAIATHITTLPA